MPVIPQPNSNGIVRSLGFAFNFSNAFATTAQAQGIPVNTSFSNLQTSLGTSNDLYPTQATAWGRANQAYAAAGGGNVPNGTIFGQVPVWDGTQYILLEQSVGIGEHAGEIAQGSHSVAVGTDAGRYNQELYNVAIGFQAGFSNQYNHATALGAEAGRVAQGNNATAVGVFAGKSNQGANALALGFMAGQTSQPANSIILNATNSEFNGGNTDALYIKPIREQSGNLSWLTYNTTTGEINSDTALPLSLGASNDTPSLTTSVWAYAQQAQQDAQYAITNAGTAISWIQTESTPNAVNAIGTYSDTPDVNTSLWALAKQAEAKDTFTTVFATALRSPDGNSAILIPNEGGSNGMVIGTNTNNLNIGIGGNLEISSGGSGNPTAYTTLTAKVLNIDVGSSYGTTNQVLTATGSNNCVWQDVPGNVGTSNDAPSLINTLWAYAKIAEIDAQNGISTALVADATANIAQGNADAAQTTANRALNYTLTGSTIGAIITNWPTGSPNYFVANTFNLATTLTMKIPPNWASTESVVFDGWALYNLQTNATNTFWGVSYSTNTYLTQTDILGSTTTTTDALQYPVSGQIYMPVNLIIPPTNLTSGGTITLRFYISVAVASQYFSQAPILNGRVGIALP